MFALVSCAAAAFASADLPPASSNFELIPAGSLIIPMDNATQNLGGLPFNLRAYGLVNRLLWDEIPVKWAIRAGKAKDSADFTALVTRVAPASAATETRGFAGGPFIVHRDFVPAALPRITAFGSDVVVYRLDADTTIDIRYTLLHKPKVATLDDGGNGDIHEEILAAAGFEAGIHYQGLPAATLATINANSCFTIASEPHFSSSTAGPQVEAIRQFALSGANFMAQCAATMTYENEPTFGHFHSTNGMVDADATGEIPAFPNPDMGFTQFVGPLAAIGGSVHNYSLAPGSVFQNGGHVHSVHSTQPAVYRASVSKLTAGTGSMVFYLGGHSYDADSIDEINGQRIYLNAVLTPAVRPPPCNLNFNPTPEIRGHVVDDVNGDGDLVDGIGRPGVAVSLWLDGGDGVASGGDDALVATTATDASGVYSFQGLAAGTYWLRVDSRSVTPAAGLTPSSLAGSLWAEQTYAPIGGLCDDGAGGIATRSAAGPCFGGRRSGVSDLTTTLAGSEHVARVDFVLQADADFGFSFSTIVNTRDGDEDGNASPRTIQGSLRQFLANSEGISGVQHSQFRIPTSAGGYTAGIWRIVALTDLPALTDPLILDGSTQPGFSAIPVVALDGGTDRNGLTIVAGDSTLRSLALQRFSGPGLTLDSSGGNVVVGCTIGGDSVGGPSLGNGDAGILVRSPSNRIGGATVPERNVISDNDKAGIKLDNGATDCEILGNHIGTDRAGTSALGNRNLGLEIKASSNTIGGTAAGAGNLISGNVKGGIKIDTAAQGSIVTGNRIGTTSAGAAVLANVGSGIELRASDCTIGGTVAGASNVVSGNTEAGIEISGGNATDNRILGNSIGTDQSDSTSLPNGSHGVFINGASGNEIGGTASGAANRIAFNSGSGISIKGNGFGNSLRANRIHDNLELGIDLDDDGVTPNDPGDGDNGPNGLQNFPVLTAVTSTAGTTTISGTLSSAANTAFKIDLWANDAPDLSNHGEGERYLGETVATTDPSGNAAFTATFPITLGGSEWLAATATAPDGSTSEFSANFSFVEVRGRVLEDPDGNGEVTDALPSPAVVVKLWRDGGDGLPSGVDDLLFGTATTDASGGYRFQGVLPGRFWVVVDSRTVVATAGVNAGHANTESWAEQSWVVAGGLCHDGSGAVMTRSVAGPCHGGRHAATSDVPSALLTSEHVVSVDVEQQNVTGVDLAFAFNVVVNTRDDDADTANARTVQGSLRQLIQNGNAVAGPATSAFRIPPSDPFFNPSGNGEYQHRLLTPLPGITDPLTLDGTTQPGHSTRPIVEIHGRNLNSGDGLRLLGGDNTVRRVIVDSFPENGIVLASAGNRVEGCWIGTDASGAKEASNDGNGILVTAATNVVGGLTPESGNVLSGNGEAGISIRGTTATGNRIVGNRIGTDVAGTADVQNGTQGVEISAGATINQVGSGELGAKNLISGNRENGIRISGVGSTANSIQGNWIGLDASGALGLANSANGVVIDAGAAGNLVGGSGPGEANVIAGNRDQGIQVDGPGGDNRVLGNRIGLSAAGPVLAVANGGHGIGIGLDSTGNAIGSTAAGAGNVIAGNDESGIEIFGGATGTRIEGNRIGTDADGSNSIGNGGEGVSILSGSNTVGGTSLGAGNEIAFNGDRGVVVKGVARGNAILGNSIHDNDALGIDLNGNGVTLNDPNDTDAGPNDYQNYPVLTSVVNGGGTAIVSGTLNSTPSTPFRVEFFSSPVADLSGYGEGRSFLGSTTVTTNSDGAASFTVTLSVTVPNGSVVTATATSPGSSTSEFSAARSPGLAVDLSLAKSVDDATPEVGQTVVFTLVVNNAAGSGNATGVVVRELLPDGCDYVSDDAATSGTSYVPSTGDWTVGSLDAGAAKTLQITATVNPSGPYVNTAEVVAASPADIDSVPADGMGDDWASVEFSPAPRIDLSLTKDVDLPVAPIGTDVVFTLVLANASGAGDATGVEVTDRLPAGFAWVADDSASSGTSYVPSSGIWRVGSLAAGSSTTLNITATILPSGPYTNEAEVSAADQVDVDSTPGDRLGDDFASEAVSPGATIDLELAKAVDPPDPAVGSEATFHVRVTNASGSSEATDVAVTDRLPQGYDYVADDATSSGTTYDPLTGIWSVGSLTSGTTRKLEIRARVAAVGPWLNAAEVTSADQPDMDSTPGDGSGDDWATAEPTPTPVVDLELTKTVDSSVVLVGSQIEFKIVVSNAVGWSEATGVAAADRLPAGFAWVADDAALSGTSYDPVSGIWSIGTLASGASRTLHITATALPGGPWTNVAEVTSANEPDIDSTPGDGAGDDWDRVEVTTVSAIDLSLAKVFDDPTPAVGDNVVCKLSLANAVGAGAATGIVVTDALPAGYTWIRDDSLLTGTTYDPTSGAWTVGDLPAGATKTLEMVVRVNATGPYVNVAEVTQAIEPDIDSTPGDGAGDDWSSAATTPQPVIDLALEKSVDNTAPTVGANVVFTLELTNASGRSDATGVEVTDLIPAGYTYVHDDSSVSGTDYDPATGRWTVGALAAGSTKSLSIEVRVESSGPWLNQAEVTAANEIDVDSTPGNGADDDWSSAATTPGALIDLSLTKSVDTALARVGDDVVFTIHVANAAGGSGATGVVVIDRLPSGFSYVDDDADASGTTFDESKGSWSVGPLPAGGGATLRLTARVERSGDRTNVAEVLAAAEPDADSTPANGIDAGEDDAASVSVTPTGSDARLEIPSTSYPGELLTLTLEDADVDADPLATETVTVEVTNDATGENVTVTLVETGPATGIFSGSVPTAYRDGVVVPGDGRLETQAGDVLTARYLDALTSTGANATVTDTGIVTGGTDGRLTLPETLAPGESLIVQLEDADANTDSGAIETVVVVLVNPVTGESETVTLTETGVDTGIFSTTLDTSYGTSPGPSGDRSIVVQPGDTLVTTYDDRRTSTGGSATVSATTSVTATGIVLRKSATQDEVRLGDAVVYTITVLNSLAIPMPGLTVADTLPAGFKLVQDSARLIRGTNEPIAIEAAGNRPVIFGPFDLAVGETVTLRYLLRAGIGVVRGEHENRATPFQAGIVVGNTATAGVRVVADALFDEGTILGKVFQDKDADDWQDEGEAGVAGAMVVLDDGTYVVTDVSGRFHFPAVEPGFRMLKLRLDSLPPGSRAVGEDSRIVRLTPGLPARADFGVALADDERSIGNDSAPGVRLESAVEYGPIDVRGKAEDLTLLVNDATVVLPAAVAQLSYGGVNDIVRLVGSTLEQPVVFRTRADDNERVTRWTLAIFEPGGQAIRELSGEGPVPAQVTWDARTADGSLVEPGLAYQYRLESVYDDGSRTASSRRVFGVERKTVISLQLTGEAFATGKAELSAPARVALDRAAEVLARYPGEKVVIEGHTDAVGASESNLDLSRRRAESARDYLAASRGVHPDRLVVRWFGEERPIASNAVAEGREMNRRVAIQGELPEVETTAVTESYRAEPSATVNGVPLDLGMHGRFSTVVPADAAREFEIALANSTGREVTTVVRIPEIELRVPAGNDLLLPDREEGACRILDPDRGGIVCTVRGRTGPGTVVELGGRPVEVGADGGFAVDLTLRTGRNTFGVLVRNGAGYSHTASLFIDVAERDEHGRRFLSAEAIPSLSVRLPADGARLPDRTLRVEGRTHPGNTVTVNGLPLDPAADGSFKGAVDLPFGTSRVTVEVRDGQGHVGRIESTYEVPKTRLFLMAFADGEFGQRSGEGLIETAGLADRSDFYTEGRVALYLKGVVSGKYLITAAFDSGREELDGLFRNLDGEASTRLLTNLDPDRYYPVYGDGSTLVYDVESQGKLYLALDGETMSGVVGNYPIALTDTELSAYQRTLYGARFVYRSLSRTPYGDPDTEVVVFGAEVRQTHVRDQLRATGGSLYYLSHRQVIGGSEQVTLLIRDKLTGLVQSEQRLQQNIDYTIKYEEGRIVFNRPISSVSAGGSLIDPAILSGQPVYLQVDYEALVDSLDKTASGLRARRQIGDHVSIGGTVVRDELQAGAYEMEGVDTEVKLGQATNLSAEYAKTRGSDAESFVSEDGGVTFDTVATSALDDGSAWKIAADVDVGEWFGDPDRWRVRAYFKDLDPGFLSSGNLAERGTQKSGLSADLSLSDKDTLRLRHDREQRDAAPAAALDSSTSSAQWERREERWGVVVELLDRDSGATLIPTAGDGRFGAARYWRKISDKLTARIERQQTISGTDNDQTTAGVQYQISPALAVEVQASEGTLGTSSQAGVIYTRGDTNVYLTERLLADQAGDRTTTVLGARSPIGKASRVYSEYQWEESPAGGRTLSLVGLQRQWDPAPGLRVTFSGETAAVSAAGGDGDRSAFAAQLAWSEAERVTLQSRNEIRFEDAATSRRQISSFAQVDYRFGSDLSLIGRYRYSQTENRDTGSDEARLDERSIGVAWRPVATNRLNAFARYTHLADLRPIGAALDSRAEREMDVLSAESLFRINPRLEWTAKLAARSQDQRLEGYPSAESDTWLTIQRLNVNVWQPFDLGLEYRTLIERNSSDDRQGWLGELLWKPMPRLRLGVGYNFTDFSDDEFSANDYSVSGWFFRVQGRY